MVKMFALIPRRPDLTEDYFHGHWGHYHSTLAVRISALRRYVQAHRIEPEVPGLPATRYDGIAECWLEELEEALNFGENPEFTEVAQKDDPNFVDLENLTAVICDMPELLWGERGIAKSTPGVKVALFLRRREEVALEAFRTAIPDAAARLQAVVPQAWRCTLARTVTVSYEGDPEPSYDAVIELWFENYDTYAATWSEGGDRVLAALDVVSDRSRSCGFIAEEWRFIWPQRPLATA